MERTDATALVKIELAVGPFMLKELWMGTSAASINKKTIALFMSESR